MSFVKLENLNDFIKPGASCVKPLEKKPLGVVAKVKDINLSDCLACSGCITSAETVLVQQQNYEELFKIINDCKVSNANKTIVVSLSLQSIVSLANKYSIPAQETAERLASFFISIGCSKVYDINLARQLSLLESYKEFKNRSSSDQFKGPIISSICPGWICYAEKTNGQIIIPHLSRVRSPQQIMGALLKKIYCSKDIAKNRADVYHVTLMPCYDKKLEASRQDFKSAYDNSQDVDCVLTPIEVEDILKDEGVTLMDFDPRPLDVLTETGEALDHPLTSHFGSTSGGYAENILLVEAQTKLNESYDKLKARLEYSVVKNSDFIEVGIKDSPTNEGELHGKKPLPKFAIVNGFRNIQTVVMRLKRNALKYDYVEIMACPSGCINGGAQCKSDDNQDPSVTIEAAKKLYNSIDTIDIDMISEKTRSDIIYKKLNLTDDRNDEILYTDFHAVPKMQNLTVNW